MNTPHRVVKQKPHFEGFLFQVCVFAQLCVGMRTVSRKKHLITVYWL